MLGGAAVHEATGLWDVHTAQDGGRRVSVTEQHVHSFLEALPLTALSIIACLRTDQVREFAAVVAGRAPAPRRLTLRRPELPSRYLAGVGAGVVVLAGLYLEEFWRCLKAEHGRDRDEHRSEVPAADAENPDAPRRRVRPARHLGPLPPVDGRAGKQPVKGRH